MYGRQPIMEALISGFHHQCKNSRGNCSHPQGCPRSLGGSTRRVEHRQSFLLFRGLLVWTLRQACHLC